METATKAKWVLYPTHIEFPFKVRHMMIINVKGEFKNFPIAVDGDDILKSSLNVIVDASSINTNNTDRDNHLKSADFFDVDNHQQLSFQSTSFKRKMMMSMN